MTFYVQPPGTIGAMPGVRAATPADFTDEILMRLAVALVEYCDGERMLEEDKDYYRAALAAALIEKPQ
jgi:hypothetical protein